ncbi:MAG: hypothetical protein L0154_05845, partial [Chloroflexi bacterium]|nr:hypothetical protein [Chloroflexota bacterium]
MTNEPLEEHNLPEEEEITTIPETEASVDVEEPAETDVITEAVEDEDDDEQMVSASDEDDYDEEEITTIPETEASVDVEDEDDEHVV